MRSRSIFLGKRLFPMLNTHGLEIPVDAAGERAGAEDPISRIAQLKGPTQTALHIER